jgi:hypothetical protein
MNDQERNTVKEIAAIAALESYSTSIQGKLSGPDFARLDGEMHVHQALLIDAEGNPMLITAAWKFSSNPTEIERAMAAIQGGTA